MAFRHPGVGVDIKEQGSLYFIGNKWDERSYFKWFAFKHVLHQGVDSIIFPGDEQVNLSSFQVVSILITKEQWDAEPGQQKKNDWKLPVNTPAFIFHGTAHYSAALI